MKDVPREYKALRELAKTKNPYDKVCPNRHLWDEGFIQGAMYERGKTAFWENLKTLIIKGEKK